MTPPATSRPAEASLGDAELERLQQALDAVPAPLEPLDVSMLDGFLCGVLVQPKRIAESRWLPLVFDVEGRPLPAAFDAAPPTALIRRRHRELDDAIGRRRWFDPWVFELDEADDDREPTADGDAGDSDASPPEVRAVYPWVAGFVTALEHFPELMSRQGPALDDALVLLYRHLDADDLEDADEMLAAIEALEPAQDLTVAVEELVRATLLLADIGRPAGISASNRGPRRSPPRRRERP